MLTFKELIKDIPLSDIPHSHQINLETLLKKMNQVREAWNHPMIVTSGYRSMQDHIRIYSQLASKRKQEFDITKVPMQSNHLKGAAVDISDPDGKLYEWCEANEKLLEDIGLWMEIKDDQARVHFQIFPPKSGHRFFYP